MYAKPTLTGAAIVEAINKAHKEGVRLRLVLRDGRGVAGFVTPCNYREVDGHWAYQGEYDLVTVTYPSGRWRKVRLVTIANVETV